MLIDRQLGDGTIFKRSAKAEEKEDPMERYGAEPREDNNNGGGGSKPSRSAHPETRRGGAAPRDDHVRQHINLASFFGVSDVLWSK